jgi:hypothetical protein
MRAEIGRRDDPPDQKGGRRNHEQAQRPTQPTAPPAAICQTTHRHRVPQKARTRKPRAGERLIPTICGREDRGTPGDAIDVPIRGRSRALHRFPEPV